MEHAIIIIFPRWLVVNYAMKLGRYDTEHHHNSVEMGAILGFLKRVNCNSVMHMCCGVTNFSGLHTTLPKSKCAYDSNFSKYKQLLEKPHLCNNT